MYKNNIVRQKSYDLALEIIGLSKELQAQKEYSLSNQLLRSGTSIGANIQESTDAQSKADFISKLLIALKEARETEYWLRLLCDSHTIDHQRLIRVLPLLNDVTALLVAIVKKTKQNSLLS